jgi:hypothetical protein
MVLMTPVVGPVADGLIKRGWKLTAVRKLSQGIAFVGPAVCMVACALLTPLAPGAAGGVQTAALVGLLSLGFALGAWSRAGLYCNHQVRGWWGAGAAVCCGGPPAWARPAWALRCAAPPQLRGPSASPAPPSHPSPTPGPVP